MKTNTHRLHRIYSSMFSHWRATANQLGIKTLKAMVKLAGAPSGKTMRRGTPGAFGYDLRPRQASKNWRPRIGCECPGNSAQRRFARRHPQHFQGAI